MFRGLLEDASILTEHQFDELSASPQQEMKSLYIVRFQDIARIKMVNHIFLFDVQAQATEVYLNEKLVICILWQPNHQLY